MTCTCPSIDATRCSLQWSAVMLVPTPDFPYLPGVRDEPKQLLRAHNPRPDVMYFIHH